VSEATGAAQPRRRVRGRPPSTRRVFLEAIGVCVVAGLLVGPVWFWLAPQFAVEMVGGALRPSGPVGESRFAADAWFAIISAAAGVLIALVLFTRHRHRPVATVAALAVAGLLGSAVAWRLGVLLGPDPITGALDDLAEGTRLEFPLGLGATGTLLAWPIASIATVIVMCLFSDDRTGQRSAAFGELDLSRGDRSEPWSLP
jgi:hypothetical protein